jgi:aminoglycoside phosphotransferase (APT) family kinase protein
LINQLLRGASEKPDLDKLHEYLTGKLIEGNEIIEIEQFPGGYSNLTFLLKIGSKEYVLRKPPVGANIKTAHDMRREYQVLKALQPVYKGHSPACTVLVIMQKSSALHSILWRGSEGIILRNRAS